MGESSHVAMELRPVTFQYRKEFGGDGRVEYGLIAEEVADVAPELVAYDGDGQPYSVRYHVLPSLLLNEVQKQQRTDERQQHMIAEQRTRLGFEAARNKAQEAHIATLLARLDALESQLASENTGTAQ